MAKGKWVYATMEMTYNGKLTERGQVLRLVGARNDDKMLDHSFFKAVESGTEVEECDCGSLFITMGHKDAHMRKSAYHNPRPVIEVGPQAAPKRGSDTEREAEVISDREFAERVAV